MNDAHLHLLVNHLPIMGSLLALPLLVLAMWRRERGALSAAVLMLVIAVLGAGAAQLTGDPAEELVEDLPGTASESQIHEHEERADIATALAVVAALAGLASLRVWRSGELPKLASAGLLALSLASATGMAWTGAAGGPIRHSELRDSPPQQAHPSRLHDDDDDDDDGDSDKD